MDPKTLEIEVRDGEKLHATWHEKAGAGGSRRPIAILCHGFGGDRKEWGRFPEAAAALDRSGIDALLFDFTGCGENPRKAVMLSKQVTDLEDVYEWAKNQCYSCIATIGLSFGGLTSVLANLPDRKVAVFWAPALYMHKSLGRSRLLLGKIATAFGRNLKVNVVSGYLLVNRKFFDDIEAVIPKIDGILSNFVTPSLIVQGLDDSAVHPEWTRAAFSCMPRDDRHKLVEVPGATHDFKGKELACFIEETTKFIQAYIPA
nr:alpha/beta fold hydrolase [Candidatus Sigynarchaeum springense]